MSTMNPLPPVHTRPHGSSGRGANVPSPSLDPFRVLRKHLTVLIAACVVGVIFGVGAWALLLAVYPQYTSQDTYEMVATITDPNQIISSELPKEDVVIRLARTEMAYLLSREVIRGAMTEPDVETTDWAGQFTDSTGAFAREDAVDELIDDLVVRYIPDTNLFEVRFSASTPEDVPVVLKAVRDSYLRYRKQIDEAQFRNDLDVFNQQEGEINRNLESLSRDIRQFVREHNILTLTDIRYHPVSQEVQDLQEKLAEHRSAVTLLKSEIEIRQAKMAGEMSFTEEDRLRAESDPTIQPLIQRLTDMRIKQRVDFEQFGPESRPVRDIETMVRHAEEEKEERVEEIMKRNLTGSIRDMNNQLENYTKLVNDLSAQLQEKDKALMELAGQVSEYESRLQRREDLHLELRATRELTTELHRVRLRSAAERVRLATRAETPRERSFPLPEIIIPLGFLLVVGVTIGVIFLREMTDKRVKSASDLAIVPGARVLGVVPDIQDDPTRINHAEMAVRDEPRSVIAESYRQACAPIMKAMERQGHQTLLVTSGLPGAGTTTVVSNLAGFLAAGGKKVLCIDANFRRPGLDRAMGCEKLGGSGLGDVLAEEAYTTDVIQACSSGISVMPAGSAANRTFERLNNGQFDAMLADMRSQYDFILIDAPPAVVAGDATVIANRTDASLLVIRANQEHRGLVAKLISQFNDAHSDLLGIILNRPRWTAGGYFKKNFATMAEYAAKS